MNRTRARAWLGAALAILAATASAAGREPVLKQVDLPHSYYWRELYLPQLTTGPSSADFMPDGSTLVYSMAGSLWRQEIDGDVATELTHARGAYDYQPDVAPDGNSVVFTRYDGKAMELWRLDLASRREQRLTSGGAVNVEPRISPDGRRLAWVSTEGTGHFNLFVADIDAAGLHGAHLLLGEHRSVQDRYYYSPFDVQINPSWSPDGKSILYVSNVEVSWGTGDIWIAQVDDPSKRRRVLSEETSWSARPEFAPDGKRILFSSYHGRQTHQLWLTDIDGAAPLPLTFGDYERRNARWSPDGRRIAYIGNADGNTRLMLVDAVGGATRTVSAARRETIGPEARLTIDVLDENGRSVPARVAVTGSDGRAHAPDSAWMHADDGFDRSLQSTESHYFHCASPCALDVPAGKTRVVAQRGFAHTIWTTQLDATAGHPVEVVAKPGPQALPPEFGRFVSADLHVHMDYGGNYRNTPANLVKQAQAEDLDVVYDLVVNKEERVPDIGYFRADADPASTSGTTLLHAQEFHSSLWGHLGLLDLNDHFLTPDFTSYRHTAMASPYPYNGVIADLAHAEGALVGYVHPFDTIPDPAHDAELTHELPADVINGKVDYMEIVSFADHKSTAAVWYRLLNLGFHLPAGAGTDAMANYASLRGPVGLNRVFLDTGGAREPSALHAALKAGHGFVSNAPLLGFLLDGTRPGDTLKIDGVGKHHYRVALRSIVPVDHLELVQNGAVVKSFELAGDRRSLDAEGELPVGVGGWILLRAWNDGADPQVLDLYPYATTNPIYLDAPGGAPPAPGDAEYFADWIDRTLQAMRARDDFNTGQEKADTLDYLTRARDGFRAMAGKGGQ